MPDYIKIIVALSLAGFGFGVMSGGNFKSINFQNLNMAELERLVNSMDFGPLNGLVNDMKEAVKYAKDTVSEQLNKSKE